MSLTLPPGPFDIIVADPPWRDDFGKTSGRSVTRHYPTMPLADICAMQVPAADAALLFLWATAPMLQQGLAVVKAWGFSYRTHGVWVKDRPGTGKWLRNQHELFLIGRRGKFRCPQVAMPGRIAAPRKRHSQKPEELQDNIEAAFPTMRYLELFARRERPGWIVWGNEVPIVGDDSLAA